MPIISFAAPLKWPEGQPPTPRTLQRNDHGFPDPLSMESSIGYLEEEMGELGITRATLFLDVEQPLIERLNRKVGSRTGACLHMKFSERNYVLACDRWQAMEDNIYALHLLLRGVRSGERWGVGTLPMLLAGFETDRQPNSNNPAAAPEAVTETWMEKMGLGPTATLDDAIAIYHRRAKLVAHDARRLTQLNILMDNVRKHFAAKP